MAKGLQPHFWKPIQLNIYWTNPCDFVTMLSIFQRRFHSPMPILCNQLIPQFAMHILLPVLLLFSFFIFFPEFLSLRNRIGGVMIIVLSSTVVDRGFAPRSDQTKDYTIGICCFSTKHAALRSKRKDWLARNQNNVSEWSDMSTRGLLFQWTSTIKIQRVGLVQSGHHHHFIECNLFSAWYSWKIPELVLSNNHSLTG